MLFKIIKVKNSMHLVTCPILASSFVDQSHSYARVDEVFRVQRPDDLTLPVITFVGYITAANYGQA
jgi:hypothetical protein